MDSEESRSQETWEKKDVWLGLLFLGLGLLLVSFVVLTIVRGSYVMPLLYYVLGGLMGLVMSGLGANAVVRALRSS